MIRLYDNRLVTTNTIDWKEIKVGDVVVEGNIEVDDVRESYRTLTKVDGKYWEYFGSDGYYHSTSPEFCHYLVKGQKGSDGYLIHIKYSQEGY